MTTQATAITRHNMQANFADAVAFGKLVFLRGVTAPDSRRDIAQQTSRVLEQIDDLLARSQCDRTGLLSATIYLVDIRQRDAMNRVWSAWIDRANVPARATVGVAALGSPDTLIEISVIAAQAQ